MRIIKKLKGIFLQHISNKKNIPFDINNTKSVMVIKYDRIGDMVVTTPIFREIKLAKPHIHISVLSSKKNYDVIKLNPHIDNIYVKPHKQPIRNLSLLLHIRSQNFDACIDLENSTLYESIFLLKIIRPKKIISIHKDGRYNIPGHNLKLYDFLTDNNKDDHCGEAYLKTINFLNIAPKSSKFDMFYTNNQKEYAVQFLHNFSNTIKIGINLKGSWDGKIIHEEELRIICNKLYKNYKNIIIIILVEPAEIQNHHNIVNRIGLPFVIQSYTTESILDAAALIDHLDLVITPDTSIVHIAAAFDTPIVTIHENNKETYIEMGPRSTLSRTVFSKTRDGLYGYSPEKVAKYGAELIDIMVKYK